MEEELQQLANLQYIDSRIDELKQLRGDLPEEILDIEMDVSRFEARLNKLLQEEKDITLENSKLELDLTAYSEKIKKYEDQQLKVRNNREYDALTKEIEAQKQATEAAHKRLEEVLKRLTEIGPEIEAAQSELDATIAELEDKKNSLDAVTKSTEQEEELLLQKREEIEKQVNPRYLKNYKRLRNGIHNGIAVVPMDRGAALGMALPPQAQVEVRRKNKVIIDETSGRIVIDKSFFAEAKKIINV